MLLFILEDKLMRVVLYFFILIFCCSCFEMKTENEIENVKEVIVENNRSVSKPYMAKCSLATYVVYQDSMPLFERPNGKIIKYFRFEDDPEYDFGGGFLFVNSEKGWLQIGKDSVFPEFEKLWVKSSYIKIGTTNYDGSRINLYEKPTKESEIVGYIDDESYFDVLNCDSDWVYVKINSTEGWLAPEFICTNPATTCN